MLIKKNVLASIKLFTRKPVNVKINDKIEFDIIAKNVAEKCGGTTFEVNKHKGHFEIFKIRDVGYDLNYEWEEKSQKYYESFLVRPAIDGKEVTFNVFKTTEGWTEVVASVLHNPIITDPNNKHQKPELSGNEDFEDDEPCHVTMSCSVDPPEKLLFTPPERVDIQNLDLYKQVYAIEHSDIILVACDNTELYSHSSVLTKYSKIFKKIYNKSSEMPVKIKIKDFDADTIEACLNFYCGNTYGVFGGKHFKAFDFAVKYEMAELKDFCLGIFAANVKEENVCELIQIAYTHDFKKLKEICKKFLAENKGNIEEYKLEKLPKNILLDVFRI